MWTQPTATAGAGPPYPPFGRRSPFPQKAHIFGRAWDALRFPGLRHRVPQAPPPVPGMFPATAALCHALLNAAHSLWIDQPQHALLHQWCRYHTKGRIESSPETADYTLITCPAQMPSLYHLNIGDGSDPATSTTLLIQVAAFDSGRQLLWSPKGLDASQEPPVLGLPPAFWRQREELQEMLPWGIDIFFIHGRSFVALPRSVPVRVHHEV